METRIAELGQPAYKGLAIADSHHAARRLARVVVVDDGPAFRRLVVETLRTRNCEVVEALDGARGLELIRRERPDLVIMDVRMPGLSGLEVTRTLAADPATAHIPVILLSANRDRADIEAGLASGARAYFTKPFDRQAFGLKVADLLYQQAEARTPRHEVETAAS